MKSSLIEEFYKFKHQKTLLYGIIVLLLSMTYGGLTSRADRSIVFSGFGAIQWIPIILIAVGSAFFAMEYTNNTIVILLYKNSSKLKVYIAKLSIVLSYGVLLAVIATFFTFVLKFILFGNKYSWLSTLAGRGTLLNVLIFNMIGTIVYSLFIVALSFMLIMLVRVNVAVIGIGLAIGFLGANFSVSLMKSFSSLVGVLKWNPLNMIFVTQQLSNNSYAHISNLSAIQIVLATILYGSFFAEMGFILFKHRRV